MTTTKKKAAHKRKQSKTGSAAVQARAYAYGLSGGKVWEIGSSAEWQKNAYAWSDYDQLKSSVQNHGEEEALVKYVWDRVMETATFRKRKGRSSVMTEPFWSLPEKYDQGALEETTLESITAMLEDAGYQNIQVRKNKEGRVTLSFNW